MDDPNAYIDIPQAIGQLSQPSLTCPKKRLRILCPQAPDIETCKNTQCFNFFDRSWFQATIDKFKSQKWKVIINHKRIGLIHLRHSKYGHIFLALLPWGASAAACRMEELRALGLRRFLIVGIGARLQHNHSAGSLFLIDQAIRDEGTSLHYLERSIFAHASFKYSDEIREQLVNCEINFTEGLSWTTDAPYRETLEKFLYWQKKVCLTVEMELAALFSLGKFHQIEVGALVVGADQLTSNGWIDSFNHPEISQTKKKVSLLLCEQLART
tara:strand:+ start:877 stop:1686 length:810 start_codon:yes stop_codon:yes gene_type:complete